MPSKYGHIKAMVVANRDNRVGNGGSGNGNGSSQGF